MVPRRWKSVTLCLVLFTVLFITSGYFLSDRAFFSELIHTNQVSTPEEAFAFVGNNTFRATKDMQLTALTTPRNMLTRQKYLYCDQSAMVLATIVDELGHETRLVDLLGDDEISHHTILEVHQNGTWKTMTRCKSCKVCLIIKVSHRLMTITTPGNLSPSIASTRDSTIGLFKTIST